MSPSNHSANGIIEEYANEVHSEIAEQTSGFWNRLSDESKAMCLLIFLSIKRTTMIVSFVFVVVAFGIAANVTTETVELLRNLSNHEIARTLNGIALITFIIALAIFVPVLLVTQKRVATSTHKYTLEQKGKNSIEQAEFISRLIEEDLFRRGLISEKDRT